MSKQASIMLGTMEWDDPVRAREILSRWVQAHQQPGSAVFDHQLWVDTADIYRRGRAETALGWLLVEQPEWREQLQVQTKIGVVAGTDETPTCYNNSGDHIRAGLERCLQHLGVDTIDRVLIHRPDPRTSLRDTALALVGAHRQKITRQVGVSNFSAPRLEAFNQVLAEASQGTLTISAHQVQASLTVPDVLGAVVDPNRYPGWMGVIEHRDTLGIEIQAYSPLSGGAVFQRAGGARIAEELSARIGAVATGWLMAAGSVASAMNSSIAVNGEVAIGENGHMYETLDLQSGNLLIGLGVILAIAGLAVSAHAAWRKRRYRAIDTGKTMAFEGADARVEGPEGRIDARFETWAGLGLVVIGAGLLIWGLVTNANTNRVITNNVTTKYPEVVEVEPNRWIGYALDATLVYEDGREESGVRIIFDEHTGEPHISGETDENQQ
ncbi:MULTISPECIES: aldo/keto reductase [Auritidibacter]|uniref:Aldo/keto reductase n=1 Tax=Auritidibacter ignavus TaxID=678932 RepID=A0AAJ6DAY7_9MICC|nr:MULTISPECIES: aldo/keto reductase [Auritidibacter]NIH71909.1 putative oxidoreductase [Auritidibacter ignavus]PXA76305.1 hypothetical protein DCC24_08235 [Auritidibacter sp. NML100628]PXA79523.1 hypothetical protein DCC25_08420 [Auritidibacter sp. NML120636]RMX22704.1 hypothetical protein DYI20_08240 [Auritidibacter ignavus]WGH80555.1 aldo/keto reductase [Auritidibacter ignavus]